MNASGSDKPFDQAKFIEQMNQMFESNVKRTMERMEQKLSKSITEQFVNIWEKAINQYQVKLTKELSKPIDIPERPLPPKQPQFANEMLSRA